MSIAVSDKDFFRASHIIGNTAKDGSGDPHNIVVNSDGQLIVEVTSIPSISGTVTIQDGGNTITIESLSKNNSHSYFLLRRGAHFL